MMALLGMAALLPLAVVWLGLMVGAAPLVEDDEW